MKYLKKFQTNAQYQDYITDKTAHKPNVSYVTDDGEVFYTPLPTDYSKKYLTFEVKSAGTITITATNGLTAKTINYSTDNGSTWTALTTSTTEQSFGDFAIGDKLLLKGDNAQYGNSTTRYNYFGGTAQVDVYGNIMSLIAGDNFETADTLTGDYTFAYLFKDNTNILSVEKLVLPATTLTDYCYSTMFQGCTSLTTAPELPATTLAVACYSTMFYLCTSLTTAPELPATTLANTCYANMFNGCTSLTTAPELPATELIQSCYNNMFRNCSQLNYVKAMFTPDYQYGFTNYLANWLSGVSQTGTFVKNINALWSKTLVGIPSGWQVETE